MLEITVPSSERYNESTNEFIYTKETTLRLEHSLVSISKWESKWCKPFLSKEQKTTEETLDYIRCMTLTQNVDPDIYKVLGDRNIQKVIDYIDAPMTATTFSGKDTNKGVREIFTSELIYYAMISQGIPFECQKWHLNRLLTLIRVCKIRNGNNPKMSKKEIYSSNKALNEARKKAMNTRG